MVGIGGRISRMTREITSLASPETLREEWAGYLGFLRRPALPDHGCAPFAAGAAALLRMLALDFAAMSLLLAIAFAVVAVGGELPETALAGIDIDWNIALLVVVVAPIAEELTFRSWLSGRPGHVLALATLFAAGVIAAMLAETATGAQALHRVAAALGGGAVLALAILFALRKRPAMGWFRAIFPALFWLSTLAFASVHLLNFEQGEFAMLLPLVLPQFILGSMLGYLRVNYGLWSNIAMHALHNGTIIAVVAIASSSGG